MPIMVEPPETTQVMNKVHPEPENLAPRTISEIAPMPKPEDPYEKKPDDEAPEEKKKKMTFDPDSEFFRNWDIFTTVLLIFTAVVTPFEVAFLDTDLSIPSSLFLFILNRMVDLGFVVDIVFTFFLPYQDEHGHYVKDLGKIANNYMRGWFPIDIASILPFDSVTAASNSTSGPLAKLKSIRIIRLLRLMKLLRVLRGMRIFSRIESRIEINYNVLKLQQFVVGLIWVTHILACTFMMLHDLQWDMKKCTGDEDQPCTWLMQYELSSYTGTGSAGGIQDSPTGVLYMICLYWALGEITGNGDLPGPTNTAERMYLLCINITAVFINAMIIGGVVAIIEAFNTRKQEFYDSMDNLNTFLREKGIKSTDRNLCQRLRQYYLFKEYHGGNDASVWEDVLERVSPTLMGEVANGMHSAWMNKVPYFQGVDRRTGLDWSISTKFRVEVALSIQSEVYAPFEPIYSIEDPADSLVVVERGLVGCGGRLIRKDQTFGQDVFLNDDGTMHRTQYANALSHLMILKVPGETLHTLLEKPENEQVRYMVRRRICCEIFKSLAMRMEKYLRLACNLEIPHMEAIGILEKEFGKGIFVKIPMIKRLWNERRAEAGDEDMKAIMVLQRAVSTYKFKLGVAAAVKKGAVIRAKRQAQASLTQFFKAAGIDLDFVKPFVENKVTPGQLTDMSAEQIVACGVAVGDAIRIKKAIGALGMEDLQNALNEPTPRGYTPASTPKTGL